MVTYKNLVQELDELKAKLEILKNADIELKQTKSVLVEKDVEINNLVNLLQQEKHAKEELLVSKRAEIDACEKRCSELLEEKENLAKEIAQVKESVSENKFNIDG